MRSMLKRAIARLFGWPVRAEPDAYTAASEEAERVYGGIWPKHPAHDARNVREITRGLLRSRRRNLDCPHVNVQQLGRTMYLGRRDAVWEWCEDCGAVRRAYRPASLVYGPNTIIEAWRGPGEPPVRYGVEYTNKEADAEQPNTKGSL